MRLIIGGAWQGKLDYARRAYGVTDAEVRECRADAGAEPDFSGRCVRGVEKFALACVRSGTDPTAYFKSHAAEWAESVLLCEDIFCGVVPTDPEMRAWREATGRLCAYLASEAESVTRVFCGIGTAL